LAGAGGEEGAGGSSVRPSAKQAPTNNSDSAGGGPAVDDYERRQGGESEQGAGGSIGTEVTAVQEGLDQQDWTGHHGQAAENAGDGHSPAASGQRDEDHAERGKEDLRREQRHRGRLADRGSDL
jgi:hypothetical protein